MAAPTDANAAVVIEPSRTMREIAVTLRSMWLTFRRNYESGPPRLPRHQRRHAVARTEPPGRRAGDGRPRTPLRLRRGDAAADPAQQRPRRRDRGGLHHP